MNISSIRPHLIFYQYGIKVKIIRISTVLDQKSSQLNHKKLLEVNPIKRWLF